MGEYETAESVDYRPDYTKQYNMEEQILNLEELRIMDFDMKMRLIGYYNKPNQNMNEEAIWVDDAQKLAQLLGATFSQLVRNDNVDAVFKSVLKGNTVFILKGEDGNLYAYYPYKKMARLTDVRYVKRDVTPVPLKYKTWFVPGQEIVVWRERNIRF